MHSAKPVPGGLSVALARDFGGVQRWRAEFGALAEAMRDRAGDVVLTWSSHEARLVNRWVETGAELPAGSTALLALAPASMLAIDFETISERYVAAVAGSTGELGITAQALNAKHAEFDLLDVRRDATFEAATDMIEGAARADPAHVVDWADRLPRTRKVVVYCVYGHEVGRSTAAALRKRGIDAHYLEGGIEEWKREGRPIHSKGAKA